MGILKIATLLLSQPMPLRLQPSKVTVLLQPNKATVPLQPNKATVPLQPRPQKVSFFNVPSGFIVSGLLQIHCYNYSFLLGY